MIVLAKPPRATASLRCIPHRRHSPVAIAALALLALAGGCAARHPVPLELIDSVHVVSMPGNIRDWGDRPSEVLQRSINQSNEQARREYGDAEPIDVLFLSAGGFNGTYAAGLLCGWSKHGSRPVFRVVSGVSIGAIIAPLAFLGSEYDNRLEDMARHATQSNAFRLRSWIELPFADSLADNAPLERFLARYFDENLMKAVAAEHAKGRRLLVTTTNLDTNRPVIWDLGAIASSGSPEALRLFRRIIVTSAAVPVFFPPSYIKVVAAGTVYDEMHVDGGTTGQLMFHGESLVAAQVQPGGQSPARRGHYYVIFNRQFAPPCCPVQPTIRAIATTAMTRMLMDQGTGDLWQAYESCRRDGLEFRLATIPSDEPLPFELDTDAATVARLFNRGYQQALNGYPWAETPAGIRAPVEP